MAEKRRVTGKGKKNSKKGTIMVDPPNPENVPMAEATTTSKHSKRTSSMGFIVPFFENFSWKRKNRPSTLCSWRLWFLAASSQIRYGVSRHLQHLPKISHVVHPEHYYLPFAGVVVNLPLLAYGQSFTPIGPSCFFKINMQALWKFQEKTPHILTCFQHKPKAGNGFFEVPFCKIGFHSP